MALDIGADFIALLLFPKGVLIIADMGKRSQGRELALLALFAQFVSGSEDQEWQSTLEFIQAEASPDPDSVDEDSAGHLDLLEDIKEASTMCQGVMAALGDIDALVSRHLRKWDFDRLGKMEQVILRIATHELMAKPEQPLQLLVAEAIKLASDYCEESSARFINGVLAGVVSELRPSEVQHSPVFDFGSYSEDVE